MQVHPLPTTYMGIEHFAVLDTIIASTALRYALYENEVAVEVQLIPDHLSGGWKVRCAEGFLGFLSAKECAEFPDLTIVRQAGQSLGTFALLELGDATVDIAVHVGPASWQIPRNNLAQGALLLAGGEGALVTPDPQVLRQGLLSDLGSCQFFAQLILKVEPNGIDLVEVLLSGRSIGQVKAPEFVVQLLKELPPSAHLSARAYAADGSVAIDFPLDSTAVFSPPVPPLPHREEFSLGDGMLTLHYGQDSVGIPAPQGQRQFIPLRSEALASAEATTSTESPTTADAAPTSAEATSPTELTTPNKSSELEAGFEPNTSPSEASEEVFEMHADTQLFSHSDIAQARRSGQRRRGGHRR